jgi:hypothetical protein
VSRAPFRRHSLAAQMRPAAAEAAFTLGHPVDPDSGSGAIVGFVQTVM